MRLKHLTLQGYKSFATKTEFLFPTGVTAIVGPNGSGKSNIADGIRWVLGEQRMRALRGKSTADMIFAGGRRRARAGMAEVSLTLDNSDGWLPIEFSEVTLTRRAHRSGENEYLVNGSRVRLRDIADLLAESGLSQRAYTVIGQGLVDAALSLRPQERRMLFEEAAGISVYRARREDAVSRLDETKRNLERVYDIVGEITPRLRRLERETERVEEHRRVSAHLERLQRTWYGYQWGRQQASLGRALRVAQALGANLERQQAEASALEERLTEMRQQEGDLRGGLRDWHRESAELHDRANEVQRELAVAEERVRLLQVRREELLAELEPLGSQRDAQAEKVAQAQAQLAQVARDLAERKERLARLESEWAVVEARADEPRQQQAQVERELRDRRARLEQLNQALLDGRAEAARLASEQAVAEERARQLKARYEDALAEIEALGGQREAVAEQVAQVREQVEHLAQGLDERRKRLADLEREWSVVQDRARGHERQREQAEQELRSRRARAEQLNQAAMEARAEAARLAGEQDALSRVRAAESAGGGGVQAVLQASLAGVLGPLAALVRVPRRWERAVEAALGADLRAVVVERFSVVDEVRRVLESTGGRVTLWPLDHVRPAPALPEGALCAADVAVCDDGAGGCARPAVETVLGTVALCENLAAARALLPGMPPGSRCATASGLVLRADGALSLGAVEVDGGAEERARQELAAQLAETQQRCQEIEARQRGETEVIAKLAGDLDGLTRQATAAREEMGQLERTTLGQARTEVAVAQESLRSRQAALQGEEAQLERLRTQLAALRQQAHDLEVERAANLARAEGLRAERATPGSQPGGEEAQAGPGWRGGRGDCAPTEGGQSVRGSAALAETQRRCREIEAQQRGEAERIATLEARLETLAQEALAADDEAARIERDTVGRARTEVAVAEESLRSQQDAVQRETALLERLRAQVSARRQRAAELETELTTVVAHAEELRADLSEVEAQLRRVQAHIQPAEDELARLREEQARLEVRERRLRDRLRDTEARQGRADLDVARCRDELKLLSRRIEEDLGLVELELAEAVTAQTPLPLRPLVSDLPVVEDLPAGLEEEIQRLKARLRRMGSVNPNAPTDYAEVQERHRFLTDQSADLEDASAQLHQVVAELDELMETAFQEIFDAVATEFSETFTTLFNGGSARLELTEPDDLMNTGVDIVARPPGKRAQRLALLSGGERALTAVALLFSLLRISPTPFCVLDEVDAMLDEANVGRFRTLLEGLAEQTQFIVITHNRVTTEAGNAIYGVSMGADGVSQVVSLQLD